MSNKILDIANLVNDIYDKKITKKEANKRAILLCCKVDVVASDEALALPNINKVCSLNAYQNGYCAKWKHEAKCDHCDFLQIVSLPTLDQLFEKAHHHMYVKCSLQNFEDEDSILLYQGKYVDGYIQGIKDFVSGDYDPDNKLGNEC